MYSLQQLSRAILSSRYTQEVALVLIHVQIIGFTPFKKADWFSVVIFFLIILSLGAANPVRPEACILKHCYKEFTLAYGA